MTMPDISTQVYRIFDAANPPGSLPPGCQGASGYIGRPGYTPHVWTPQQWQPFHAVPQLPYWVPNLAGDPILEARAAVSEAMALGWAPHMPEPLTRAILFDFETAEGAYDRQWWAACSLEVETQGFADVAYGSLSTILELAASDIIIAAWDDISQLLPGQTIHGHQYVANVAFDGTNIDYTMIDKWLFQRGGVGPRHLS